MSWVWLSHVVNSVRQPANPERQLERWRFIAGAAQPQLCTLGFTDETIGFYARRDVERVNTNQEILSALKNHADHLILIVDSPEWNEFAALPASAAFERAGEWSRWARPPAFVMRPKPGIASAATVASSPTSQP